MLGKFKFLYFLPTLVLIFCIRCSQEKVSCGSTCGKYVLTLYNSTISDREPEKVVRLRISPL